MWLFNFQEFFESEKLEKWVYTIYDGFQVELE